MMNVQDSCFNGMVFANVCYVPNSTTRTRTGPRSDQTKSADLSETRVDPTDFVAETPKCPLDTSMQLVATIFVTE